LQLFLDRLFSLYLPLGDWGLSIDAPGSPWRNPGRFFPIRLPPPRQRGV